MPAAATVFEPKKIEISFRWLLAIYAIVPILLSIVFIDSIFLGNAIQPYVSVNLKSAFIYLLFFELPHIFASFISFADREYLSHYKKQLFYELPILLVASCLLAYISLTSALVAIITYTLYHVLAQQTGIARMMIGKTHILYTLWNLTAVAIAVLIQMYVMKIAPISLLSESTYFFVFSAFTVVFFILSLVIFIQTKAGIGKKYFSAITLSLFAGILFFLMNYLFFAVTVLRFVHDITAFYFYIAHDVNRNATTVKNSIYKVLTRFKIPILISVPALGILMAYVIRYPLNLYNGIIYTAIIVNFSHFYLEGFIWKRGSLHRDNVSFVE